MDVDPRTNVVVFQLNKSADEIAIGRAPTVAEDGVRQAWGGVLRDHGAAPEAVVALHSEWEPTPTDMAFIEATFPEAAVTFNFRRPDQGGWEDAFAAAQATMVEAAASTTAADGFSTPAMARPRAAGTTGELRPAGVADEPHPADGGRGGPIGGSGAHQPAGAGRHVPTDGDESAPTDGDESSMRPGAGGDADQDSGRGELLPVLWSGSSPRAGLLEAVPHWPVAAGRLHLALAVVAPTPRGTIGMYHVTHHQLGGQSFDELMAEACENLAAGLRVNSHEADDGQLLSLSGTLVAAAVCLPDFYRRLSEITHADRLVVGLPCPDEVYVAAADSPMAAVIHRAVRESEYPATELVPSVLLIAGDDIEVISERE